MEGDGGGGWGGEWGREQGGCSVQSCLLCFVLTNWFILTVTSVVRYQSTSLWHITMLYYHGRSTSLWHITMLYYHGRSTSLWHITMLYYHGRSTSLWHITMLYYHGRSTSLWYTTMLHPVPPSSLIPVLVYILVGQDSGISGGIITETQHKLSWRNRVLGTCD